MHRNPDLRTKTLIAADELGSAFVRWARTEAAIRVIVLIGSRGRSPTQAGAADTWSDWDFQIVTSNPALFTDPGWTQNAGLPAPLAYVARTGRLGRVMK